MSGFNILVRGKGDEQYVFLYDDESVPTLLQIICNFAADPEVSLTWYDAAVLGKRIKQMEGIYG